MVNGENKMLVYCEESLCHFMCYPDITAKLDYFAGAITDIQRQSHFYLYIAKRVGKYYLFPSHCKTQTVLTVISLLSS